jgi:opacity protein-like surface antigen
MKKNTLALLIVFLALLLTKSSAWAAERPTFGLLGGLSLGNIVFDPDRPPVRRSFSTRGGLGGFVEFDLSPTLALQARAMYVQKGANLSGALGDGVRGGYFKGDYVTVPLLLKYKPDLPRLRPYVMVGPEIGFKTHVEATVTDAAFLAPGEKRSVEDFGDDVDSTDVALDFGAGLEIPSRHVAILIEALYWWGLKNVDASPEAGESAVKTRTFLVNVGVRF